MSTLPISDAPSTTGLAHGHVDMTPTAHRGMSGRIRHPLAVAAFSLRGGCVTHWQPIGHEPVLWLSQLAPTEDDRLIDGGIPICFPWFGRSSEYPARPSHGVARLAAWRLARCDSSASGVEVVLKLHLQHWRLVYNVLVGRELKLSLSIENRSPSVRTCEAALHSCFRVADVRRVQVHGLERMPFVDKSDGNRRCPAEGIPLRVAENIDRIYKHPSGGCTINDPGLRRQIHVETRGANSTVLWNPGGERAKLMPEFVGDDWRRMLCLETAAVREDALHIGAGERAVLEAKVSLSTLNPPTATLLASAP